MVSILEQDLSENGDAVEDEVDAEAIQSVVSIEVTNPVQPDEKRAQEKGYDSDDSDYIPEDENFVSVEVRSVGVKTEETLEEKQQRFLRAVESMPEEITQQLDDLLRGRYVALKKIPRSEWI